MSRINAIETIGSMLLDGASNAEIIDALSHLRGTSVATYIRRVRSEFNADQLRQMAAARRTKGTDRSPYHTKFSARPALGPLHTRIGRKLIAARQEAGMIITEFCKEHGVSNHVTYSVMEQGYHDFKLTELEQIAQILGVPLPTILE